MSRIRIILSALNKSVRVFKKANASFFWLARDMYALCLKHHVGTNTYVSERLWDVLGDARIEWLRNYDMVYQQRCEQERKDKEYWAQWNAWRKRYLANRKFLLKYSSMKWDCSIKRMIKRNNAYIRQYNMGEGCSVQHNVTIISEHGYEGCLKIGENVIFSKNVFVDYTGNVEIGNNVHLTNGVIIESHHHPFLSDYRLTSDSRDSNYVEISSIKICDGAVLGSRAIILASCHYIGKYARIGAGAVVTHDVPDYAIVTGVPARVIRMMEH